MEQALKMVEAQVGRLSNLWDRAQALVVKVVEDVKPTLGWVAEQASWLVDAGKDMPKTILARGLAMIAIGIGLLVSIFTFPAQLGTIVAVISLMAIFSVIAYAVVFGCFYTLLGVVGIMKGVGHE